MTKCRTKKSLCDNALGHVSYEVLLPWRQLENGPFRAKFNIPELLSYIRFDLTACLNSCIDCG
jgi:hypothetical protein